MVPPDHGPAPTTALLDDNGPTQAGTAAEPTVDATTAPPVASRQEDFATALARAIRRNGETLASLAAQLQEAGFSVSTATLSYWQTGRSLPTRTNSVKAVTVLEGLLGLAPGKLTRLLPGAQGQSFDPISVLAQDARIAAALRELDLLPGRETSYSNKFVEQAARVAVDGRTQRETIRQIFQAEAEVLRHLPLIFHLEQDELTRPRIVGIAGCTVGGQRSLEGGLTIVQLTLDRPLQRGELGLIEYRIDWPVAPDGDHNMSRGIPDGVDYMVQSLQFDGAVPHAIDRWELQQELALSTDPERVGEQMAPASFVQQVHSSPTAGAIGMHWEF